MTTTPQNVGQHSDNSRQQQSARDHLWMHFTRHSTYADGAEIPVDRARRRRLHLGRQRAALPRRAVRAVRGAGRARAHRARRGRRASRPASWRSSRCGPTPTPSAIELAERLADVRARRPQPGVLHHRRRRGRRDRVEARQAVLQAHRQAHQAQGDQPGHRLPRHPAGRPVASPASRA